jgi:hypothetical protein
MAKLVGAKFRCADMSKSVGAKFRCESAEMSFESTASSDGEEGLSCTDIEATYSSSVASHQFNFKIMQE